MKFVFCLTFLFASIAFIFSQPDISATKVDALVDDSNMNGMVDNGDEIEYTVVISNTGSDPALNVEFNTNVDPNTTLDCVTNMPTTTQGSIDLCNSGALTVGIGSIAAANSATIIFRVAVNATASTTSISCQGSVTADDFSEVLTDDPDVGGSADPTVTPVHPLCEPGFSSPSEGQTCAACPEGRLQELYGQYECLTCPTGTYQDQTGSIDCKSCPPNTYSSVKGATSLSTCIPCETGLESPPGSGSPDDCVAPGPPIPTLGHWGLIMLSLLFLIIGIIATRQSSFKPLHRDN